MYTVSEFLKLMESEGLPVSRSFVQRCAAGYHTKPGHWQPPVLIEGVPPVPPYSQACAQDTYMQRGRTGYRRIITESGAAKLRKEAEANRERKPGKRSPARSLHFNF
jgi:hypothetical protein